MAKQTIGSIPEFTSDSTPVEPSEVDQKATSSSDVEAAAVPAAETEKVTPPEPPTGEQPAVPRETERSGDTRDVREELFKEIEGLKEARRELIYEIKDLRGQKRESKQDELATVEEKIDKLEDVNQDDVTLIDRILKAKGYVSSKEVESMLGNARKADVMEKFFKEYPEYSEDNDPDRKKFGPLLREVALYKEPTDPAQYAKILRRAHQAIAGTSSPSVRGAVIQKRQIEIAGVGSGGAQRSSSVKTFDAGRRANLRAWGWSEEDIANMEARSN